MSAETYPVNIKGKTTDMFLDNGYLKSMQHANTSEVDLANANLLESEWLIFLDITEYNMKILLELS